MQVKFGDFVLDRGTRQLLRGGEERRLAPKAFELLELLLDHRPNVVARERIRDRLWPDTFVSESTLATLMAEVRAALGEGAKRPVFLRTVHGVGFAFCGQAVETRTLARAATNAGFRLVLEDREVALHPGENLLGRVEEGVAWLESSTVSRRHACIRVEGGRWGPRVIDLDLLVHGLARINEEGLNLPHPGIADRNFVLFPLLEIAPGLEVPGIGRVVDLAARLDRSGLVRVD